MSQRSRREARTQVVSTLRPRPFLWKWVGATALLAGLSTAEFYVRLEVQGAFSTSDMLFYLDTEGNLPTWVSGAGLAFAGVLAALAARAQRSDGTATVYWALAAFGFVFMSVDELCQYHEHLTEPLWVWLQSKEFTLGGYLRNAWVLPFLVLVPLVALAFVPFLRKLDASHRKRLVVAALVYGFGVLGMDMVSGREFHQASGFSMTLLTLVTIEEVFELLGIGLFLYALLAYLGDQQASVRFGASGV